MNERDIVEGQTARDWYFNRFGVDETQPVQTDTVQGTNHQVESVSTEAATMGQIALRALVGLVRGMPYEEKEKLGVPSTLDMRLRNLFEVWFDEKAKHPWSSTAFYESQLTQRLGMPKEEVETYLQTARELSLWLNRQFFGAEIEDSK